MEVKINNEIYDIRWRHERDFIIENKIKGRTVAYIWDINGKAIETYANCSIHDTYNKKLGRRIATGRLFKILGLDTQIANKL